MNAPNSSSTLGNAHTLRVFARGLQPSEKRLLEGTVMVSQRRTPKLELLAEEQLQDADVILIDAQNENAVRWAKKQPWLNEKAVIWVDGEADIPDGHTTVPRPVQWPTLPTMLAKALEVRSNTSVSPPQTHTTSHVQSQYPNSQTSDADLGRSVLVVDDSLAVRKHLQSLLSTASLTVEAVENGQEALDLLASMRFDCVLMDVLMPGIDGYEASRQIKAQSGVQGPAIVMLTSKSSPFDRIRGMMSGCDAYLTKPVDPQELYATLSQYVEIPRFLLANAPISSRSDP